MKSMSNVRWRKAPNETPCVLEGSGLTTAPVDGTGRKTRGMRTRVDMKYHETLRKSDPYKTKPPVNSTLMEVYGDPFLGVWRLN
ncbi:hypothetical protein [Sulfodiicoccus acidiphilus]|uniref:hypothetical protein n=1 Tax=Sulfodiicoccus acidiphilus TaxID=1670455 RepID=UPI00138FDAB6|nr:hypothetical protein [Sulfodiicoccus acidiphilus]